VDGQVAGRHGLGDIDRLAQRPRDAAGQQPCQQGAERERQGPGHRQHRARARPQRLAAPGRGVQLAPLHVDDLLHVGEVAGGRRLEPGREHAVGAFQVARQLELADLLAGRQVALAELAGGIEQRPLLGLVHLGLDEFLQVVRLLDRAGRHGREVGDQGRIAALGDGGGALDAGGRVAQPIRARALGAHVPLDHRVHLGTQVPQLDERDDAAGEREDQDEPEHECQALADGELVQGHAVRGVERASSAAARRS
jgi:hypothetical protein